MPFNPESLKNLRPRKKGEPALNPNGRPKAESLTAVLNRMMEEKCPQDKQGRTWKQLIVISTLQNAMKGNASAQKEVWDRYDGKLKEHVDIGADTLTKMATSGVVKLVLLPLPIVTSHTPNALPTPSVEEVETKEDHIIDVTPIEVESKDSE